MTSAKFYFIFMTSACFVLGTSFAKFSDSHLLPRMFTHNQEVVIGCKTKCLNEYIDTFDSAVGIDEGCKSNEDCVECWEYCDLIFKSRHRAAMTLCHDENCNGGCKYACGFYRLKHHKNLRHSTTQTIKDKVARFLLG